jgi:hypothetical protein
MWCLSNITAEYDDTIKMPYHWHLIGRGFQNVVAFLHELTSGPGTETFGRDRTSTDGSATISEDSVALGHRKTSSDIEHIFYYGLEATFTHYNQHTKTECSQISYVAGRCILQIQARYVSVKLTYNLYIFKYMHTFFTLTPQMANKLS